MHDAGKIYQQKRATLNGVIEVYLELSKQGLINILPYDDGFTSGYTYVNERSGKLLYIRFQFYVKSCNPFGAYFSSHDGDDVR